MRAIAASRRRGGTARISWRMAVAAAALMPVVAGAAGLGLTSQHLTTLATCALVSYPSAAALNTDTWVNQSVAIQNNGTQTAMQAQSGTAANQRIYLRFDLTQCLFAPPAGAIVRTATLRLFETSQASACRTYDVFKLATSWTETGVTWQNQPAGTTSNNPPSSQRTSSQNIGNVVSCATHTANTFVGFDVTADVGAFLAGSSTNNGWMIRDDAEDSATTYKVTFTTHEAGVLAQAPQLLIDYTLV